MEGFKKQNKNSNSFSLLITDCPPCKCTGKPRCDDNQLAYPPVALESGISHENIRTGTDTDIMGF